MRQILKPYNGVVLPNLTVLGSYQTKLQRQPFRTNLKRGPTKPNCIGGPTKSKYTFFLKTRQADASRLCAQDLGVLRRVRSWGAARVLFRQVPKQEKPPEHFFNSKLQRESYPNTSSTGTSTREAIRVILPQYLYFFISIAYSSV
jgi:hypothetical protein